MRIAAFALQSMSWERLPIASVLCQNVRNVTFLFCEKTTTNKQTNAVSHNVFLANLLLDQNTCQHTVGAGLHHQ